MRIVSIETIPIALPYESGAAPLPLGGRTRTKMESLLIKIITDTGLVGWGDAFGVNIWPVTRTLFERLIVPLCTGADPLLRIELMDMLSRTLYHFGLAGPLQYALSGLDIALWDIEGKNLNVPVHALIGPCRNSVIPVYASLLPYRDAPLAARYAARAVADGYRYVKLHERDVASVVETRAAIGNDVGLMVDLNCAFDLSGAEQFAHDVSHCNPMWLEEPVFPPNDYKVINELSWRVNIPLALGENVGTALEFERIIEDTGIRYAQPSAIKTGGITALLQVAKAASEHKLSLMPHSAYFGPGLLATLHVLATIESAPIIERFYCDIQDEPCGSAAHVENGLMHVPDTPGLGFEPNLEILEKYAVLG